MFVDRKVTMLELGLRRFVEPRKRGLPEDGESHWQLGCRKSGISPELGSVTIISLCCGGDALGGECFVSSGLAFWRNGGMSPRAERVMANKSKSKISSERVIV